MSDAGHTERIVDNLPSPMNVYAIFLGMGVGVYYATGNLLFVIPGGKSNAVQLGMMCFAVAGIVLGFILWSEWKSSDGDE